ncbi:Metal cation transporter, ZIP family [Aphelenchoides besseyi]|nr:Metal cation transporter, ZIP family [Aphelenchoides besseyi]
MVNALTLKLILLVFMFLVAFVFGLMPLKLHAHLTKNKGRIGRRSQIALSLLSCFCGGVILGVCLLELLPEARESLEKIEAKLNWKAGYPYVELFTGVGLFIVYLVEELIGKFFGLKHDHSDEGAKEAFRDIEIVEQGTADFGASKKVPDELGTPGTISPRPSTPATSSSASLQKDNNEMHNKRKAVANALSFVLALVCHTSLEGFAFGVQDEVMSISSLFFGIISHKALVAFSVGMSLTKALNHNLKIVFILVTMLALFSPVGGLIGILVQSTGTESTPKAITSAILTCFSIGTFLYIAFFEILAPERHNDSHPKLLQWLSCVLGFACMGLFIALGEGHGHDHAEA